MFPLVQLAGLVRNPRPRHHTLVPQPNQRVRDFQLAGSSPLPRRDSSRDDLRTRPRGFHLVENEPAAGWELAGRFVLVLDLQDEALHPAPGGVGAGESSVIVHGLEPIFASAAWASPRTRTTEAATLAKCLRVRLDHAPRRRPLDQDRCRHVCGLTSSMVSRSARVI